MMRNLLTFMDSDELYQKTLDQLKLVCVYENLVTVVVTIICFRNLSTFLESQ